MDKWLKLPVMSEIPSDYDYSDGELNSLDVSVLVGIISQLADSPLFLNGSEKIAGGSVYFPHLRAKLYEVQNMASVNTTIEGAKQLAGDCGCNGATAAAWPSADTEAAQTQQQQQQACRVATKIIDVSIQIVGAIVSIHSAWVGAFNPQNYALLLIAAVVAILGVVLGGVVIPAIALIGAVGIMLQQGLSSAVMLGYWQAVLDDMETNRCERINYLVSSDSPAIAKTRLLGFLENISQGQMLGDGWGRAVKSVFGLLVPNGLFEAMFDLNLLAMSVNWSCGCGCDNVAPTVGGDYGTMFNWANGEPPIGPLATWIDNGISYQTHQAALDNQGHYSLYLSLGDSGVLSDCYFNVVAIYEGRIIEPQNCSIAIDLVSERVSQQPVWVCIDGSRCLMSPMVGRRLAITSSESFRVKLSNEGN